MDRVVGPEQEQLWEDSHNEGHHGEAVTSVAATKVSSTFHAKVSRKFWQEGLKLFDETLTRKFRQKISNFPAKIVGKISREIVMKASLPQHYP